MRLAFSGVGGGDGVDDGLGLFVADFCEEENVKLELFVARESGLGG